MTDPWTQPELPFEGGLPPSTNEFDLKSLVGCAILIAVGGCHADMLTRFGVKPVVRGACVVLNGPDAGKEYIDVLFFNSRVVRTLRGVPGRAFIAHVDIDQTTTNPAVVLLDPAPEEYELARKWHADNPERTADLIRMMVSTFSQAEQAQAANQQQRPAQQQQPARSAPPSAPPTGPNYGRTPPPSAPPTIPLAKDIPPSPTRASVRGEAFEPIPGDEPPF